MNWLNSRRCLGLLAAVVGSGSLLLGGCNEGQKADSARMADENAQLKVASTQRADDVAKLRAENDRLRAQAAPVTQTPMPETKPIAEGKPARDIVIEIAGDVLFASGQVSLRPEGKAELEKIAKSENSNAC